MRKLLSLLNPGDFIDHPVWEFGLSDSEELWIENVDVPVSSLGGRLVGALVTLANGTRVFAMFYNLRFDDSDAAVIFLGVAIWNGSAWVHLPRPCDFGDIADDLQTAAKELGLALSEIYPLRFDLRSVLENDSPGLVRCLDLPVKTTLSMDELVAMALNACEEDSKGSKT